MRAATLHAVSWNRRASDALSAFVTLALLEGLATGVQGCHGADYRTRSPSSPRDASETTTTGAVFRPSETTAPEEEADQRQRLEREMDERQRAAAAVAGPEASADAQTGIASPEQRAAFSEWVGDQIAALDTEVDDVRARVETAETTVKVRVERILTDIAQRRARLEQARKRLEHATGDEWRRVHDELQVLIDETRLAVKSARDALE
jgi:hypothetical protein